MGILNLALVKFTGPRVPGLAFLLVVVLLALKVGRGPVLLAGALSAVAWNYFFLPPVLRSLSQPSRTAFCSAFISSVAIVPASWWRASGCRKRPNAAARNGPRCSTRCRATCRGDLA